MAKKTATKKRKANPALLKIVAKAKEIRKKSPAKKWTDCIKEAAKK
ncbi:MAG: hypothetical protein WC389_16030 [Lutibacter sp.]|jgi:hypothetical protein